MILENQQDQSQKLIISMQNYVSEMNVVDEQFEENGTIRVGNLRKYKNGLDRDIEIFNRLQESMEVLRKKLSDRTDIYMAGLARMKEAVSILADIDASRAGIVCPEVKTEMLDFIDDTPADQMTREVILEKSTNKAYTLGVRSVVVKNIRDVKPDSSIYFIESMNKFSFILGGELFLGNMGDIYTNEKFPKKIRNCNHGHSCPNKSTCPYYHAGSKDVRNFVSGSFSYTTNPANTGCKHFGSRSRMQHDLEVFPIDELGRHSDQLVHDVISTLILRRNMGVCRPLN